MGATESSSIKSVPWTPCTRGALQIASEYAAGSLRQGDPLTSQLSTARLSRRGFLGGSLAAAAGLCFSGCGTAVSAGLAGTPLDPETVTYWNLFGGGDGARMLTMLDTYRASHPNPLEAATFTWGNPYYTKVSLATLGGYSQPRWPQPTAAAA